MILAERQMYPMGRNTIGPVNTVSTMVRSGLGTALIRLGRWVAPTDGRQPAGPVLNTI